MRVELFNLGGYYYLTCDEVELREDEILLIEAKHTRRGALPSESDIKDGLMKMILFVNLDEVSVNNELYHPTPVLKLISNIILDDRALSIRERKCLKLLKREAEVNGFKLKYNDEFLI